MNSELLRRHIHDYIHKLESASDETARDLESRTERLAYYAAWTASRMKTMSRDDLYEYVAKLWAMLIWGNKDYVVDKLISDNGLDTLRTALAVLVWGADPVAKRWDVFRKQIKGIGPAMMSELLVYVHPKECLLWNRRAYVGLNYLGVPNLPVYNYQLTGKRYVELCAIGQEIARKMEALGCKSADLLSVDYFIWSELQVAENLSQIHKPGNTAMAKPEAAQLDIVIGDNATAEFVHNEVRDKLAQIGTWLGLRSRIEVPVADGAKVDAIWEATIGNMGRTIYVFEVQTRGSVDSLILNLMKSLNNPAVQGVVAVSDKIQLKRIEQEAAGLPMLKDKIKYWDYTQVLDVHEALESVNETINSLGLVPQGF